MCLVPSETKICHRDKLHDKWLNVGAVVCQAYIRCCVGMELRKGVFVPVITVLIRGSGFSSLRSF